MEKELKIKVCGMKFPTNKEAVASLGVDILGFIFYAPSKRYVGTIEEDEKAKLFDTRKEKAGVFVNEEIETIINCISEFGFNYIQLHGDESPSFCKELKKSGVRIIKAFRVGKTFDFSQLSNYTDSVDYFLFDTKAEQAGGTGKKFDWFLLNNYTLQVPFFLSGGIGPDDVNSIKGFNHPMLFGVDLNSGFEDKPGEKNSEKLNQFIKQLKQE